MRLTISRRDRLILLCLFALTLGIPAWAQTPAAAAAPAAPASPGSPATLTPSEQREWSPLGASAECRDGTFFHGKLDARTCADRGGIRKLLQGRDQVLIR